MESRLRWTLLMLIVGALVAGCRGTVDVGVTPVIPPLIAADFDSCTGVNNLGGQMGAAYDPPDSLIETYPEEAKRGCVARLDYEIREWSAFWMKLQDVDLRSYSKLGFDVRADPQPGIPGMMKLELKRANMTEVSIKYVSGIEADWKTISVSLADFDRTPYAPPLSSLEGMEELVFTFEASRSGPEGVVYLDNIVFKR